jgi:glycosyltransferase involved in cell wall biosynthesis
VTLTDTLVEDRELVSPGSPASSAIAWLDRRALKLADLVMVDTEENADYITSRFGIDRAQIIVFPVGVDCHIFHPAGQPEHGAREWLDVLFYGKFIPLHGVETIVRAAHIVEREHPGVRFELIGRGQDYKAARRLAASLGTQSIKWTDWLPYEALGARLREADVALGVFSAGTKAARVIPNKVHQALACGVPLVTRRSPAIERLLQDGESAFLVPPDDPEALARALLRLAVDRDLRLRTGARGREVWQEFASEECLSAKAREALERVGLAC